jgi:D-erythritol 1-phosphate dehydrogenase
VFGGKITTFRKLAEQAMQKLAPYYPAMKGDWTRTAPLPGGDLPGADLAAFQADLLRRYTFLPTPVAHHYARQYGTRTAELLEGAQSIEGLGRHFGGRLYEREADFLVRTEWARDAEDVLTRRTKHHLHLSRPEQEDFAAWMARAA